VQDQPPRAVSHEPDSRGTVDHVDWNDVAYVAGSGVERSSAPGLSGHPPEIPTHGIEGGDPWREPGGVLLDQ
jgi:hypothetical protein